eukprot:2137704-Amphidinium_carterae.1
MQSGQASAQSHPPPVVAPLEDGAEDEEADQTQTFNDDEPAHAPVELSPEESVAQEVAAIKIQAVHRGNLARHKKHRDTEVAHIAPPRHAPPEEVDEDDADLEETMSDEPAHAPPEDSREHQHQRATYHEESLQDRAEPVVAAPLEESEEDDVGPQEVSNQKSDKIVPYYMSHPT